MEVIYIKFWVQFVCAIDDGHRKDTLLLRKNKSIIFSNTPLLPWVSPAPVRIPCSLSLCLLQETGRFWCQSQHRWFPSTLKMNSGFPCAHFCSWGSPQTCCFRQQPHICCCLLSTDKFSCAGPGKKLCFQLRHLQLLLTSQISWCSTISTSLLLSFPRKKPAASWITEKNLKSRVKRQGREEVRREDKKKKKEATFSSLLQASWIHLL